VVVRDGRVFTAADVVRALDARTGVELWRFQPDTIAPAEPAVDERAFYIATRSRRVYALDVATGQPLWNVEAFGKGPYPVGAVGVVTSGDTVYASFVEDTNLAGGYKRGWIIALDRRSGLLLWRYVNERANEAHDAGRATIAGPMLLADDLNGNAMVGLNRFTGREMWRLKGAPGWLGPWDGFRYADGVAYIASNDTHAYALDPETGTPKWITSLGASASSSAVCGDYVFASAGGLHMLQRSDGKNRATMFLNRDGNVENEWVRSRLLSYGGRVYFAGNQALYAVECS
jgi:outer membrane protein assembly factor BamB